MGPNCFLNLLFHVTPVLSCRACVQIISIKANNACAIKLLTEFIYPNIHQHNTLRLFSKLTLPPTHLCELGDGGRPPTLFEELQHEVSRIIKVDEVHTTRGRVPWQLDHFLVLGRGGGGVVCVKLQLMELFHH